MTNKELHDKLKTIWTKYLYGEKPLGIDMETFPADEISHEKIKKRYNALLRLQNASPKEQSKNTYPADVRKAVIKYMRMGALIKSMPKYACYKQSFEDGLKTADKLISRVTRLDSDELLKYSAENPTFNIEDFLNNKSCVNAFCSTGAIEAIKTVYVPSTIRDKLKQAIPKDPKNEYPAARKLKRHFILHIGLTNTGKTYHSIERLKQAETGVYLGPLRLLALEIQENLNNSGVPCSLVTGEEEDIVEGARHVASTVEKLNINEKYDVAVIDECQLLSDGERGCSWARAILGVQSEEIHLAMAPEGENIVIKIIESCGDSYEIVRHERNTKLTFSSKRYKIPESIEQGDALIVFSRKEALFLGEMLSNQGIPTSVIYGALPYNSRKKQLERFVSGETKVVVSTDAIGMGLNLPIRRIVFVRQDKFDGIMTRPLLPPEVKQIAGRAGRMGMYPEGFVLSTLNQGIIRNGLEIPNEDIDKAYVGFNDIIVSIDGNLIDILKTWRSMPTSNIYRKTQIGRYVILDSMIRPMFRKFRTPTKEEELKMLNIPFDEKNDVVLKLWLNYVENYLKNKPIEFPYPKGGTLKSWEDSYKCLELYYSFSKNFGYEVDKDLLNEYKERVTNSINKMLLETLSLEKQLKSKSYKNRRR